MKRLFWKEWREQFKVALIGLAIFTLILLQAVKIGLSRLSSLDQGYETTIWADGLQPLVSGELLGESAFFCGFFGLALGWLQIFAENHGDLRAFLLHRPVDRLLLLHAKLLSGLALYTLAVGLPFAGLLVYVLMPGHVPAPFEWAMVGPMTNLYLLGLVGYGAGLLTGLRPARWYGSRIFALGPAILATIAVFACREYWQALGVLVVAGLALYFAVRGAFQTGGVYPDQKWTAKLALSLTCAVAGLLLCALGMAVLDMLLRSNTPLQNSYYAVTKTGEVYRVVDNGKIFDLNGHPLLDKKSSQPVKMKDFFDTWPEWLQTGVNLDNPNPARVPRRESYFSSLRYFVPWRVSDKVLWYWTRDGHLAGYNGITRQMAGILIPSGLDGAFWVPAYNYQAYFQPNQPAHVLGANHALYWVDAETHTVKRFFTATNQEGIGGFSDGYKGGNVLVVTRDTIRLLDPAGGTDLALRYEPGWPNYCTIAAYWLPDTNGFVVQFIPNHDINQKLGVKLSNRMVWFNAAGKATRTLVLPKLPEYEDADIVGNACSLVIPPALRLPMERIANPEYRHNVWDLLSGIPALLSAVVGWRVGRRYHFSGRDQVAWAGFHLIFGVPGLIAFFSVQEWPAKESCPHCRKLRMVNRERCEYCGGAFAPPASNGTEIFEPMAAEVKG
jgi:hypothetical protein